MSEDTTAIPRALESYPSGADQTLTADLAMRVQIEPFNAIATGVFVLAILHTFAAARFARLAHRVQHRHDDEARVHGRPASPSLGAEALHFLGEVEVVFGLWAVVLVVATTAYAGWETARHYVSDTVNYDLDGTLTLVVKTGAGEDGPALVALSPSPRGHRGKCCKYWE